MYAGHKALAALLAAGALVAAGCGDDDDGGGDAQSSPAATVVAIEVSESGGKATFTVPDTVEAGLAEVRLTNRGRGQHEAQLIRVDGDQSAEEVVKVTNTEGGPLPEWLHGAGGPEPVDGGESTAVAVVLEPGTYHVLDMAEEGAAEPATFTVEGEVPAGAALPDAPAKIVARDYSFEATGLTPGRNTVRFENAGDELHHVIAVPFTDDEATTEDLVELFASDEEPSGPPPIDFEKETGTTVIDGGTEQNVQLDLEAGRYALICFIQDRAGGPPHAVMGMVSEAVVE